MKLDEFTEAYIDCALWSTNDESTPEGGVPFDDNYGYGDIDDDTLRAMIVDCEKFQRENCCDIAYENCFYRTDCSVESHAGHNFWLTRNGHGAGFWDDDWEEAAGERMTKSSKAFGEFNLCLGDDGKIYS